MKTILKDIRKRTTGAKSGLLAAACFLTLSSSLVTSCEDFFDQESEHVIYADNEHLNSAVDTVYTISGILSKLQNIADRTILLGELRGDLVDVTANASSNVQDIAAFRIGEDNPYNSPTDYYAVINNCNYLIHHADTALRNSATEYVFMREFAAAKTIRAWVYLQLALNYGNVPFSDVPILTKEDADAAENGTKMDLQGICDYFIDDLNTLRLQYTNTDIDIANAYPHFGGVGGYDVRYCFFPLNVVLGDLYLWRASLTGSKADYRNAAEAYYRYISQRNGSNSYYPVTTTRTYWRQNTSTWMMPQGNWSSQFYTMSSWTASPEYITIIPGAESRTDGFYSDLRDLFCSTEDNEYKVSIKPSQAIIDLSESQAYCVIDDEGEYVSYAPAGLDDNMSGDLRLYGAWRVNENGANDKATGEYIETQSILKYGQIAAGRELNSKYFVPIYRRTLVYLRLAEALNQCGLPRMAYKILETGINDNTIANEVRPYTLDEDTTFLSGFKFNSARYLLFNQQDWTGKSDNAASKNTLGLHSRGSGWTPRNEYYRLPNDTLVLDSIVVVDANGDAVLDANGLPTKQYKGAAQIEAERRQLIAEQQLFVDSLILNEGALEFAFEGTRFYDLMRYAMRYNDNSILADRVYARRGAANAAARSGITVDLKDRRQWYLNWNGKFGW